MMQLNAMALAARVIGRCGTAAVSFNADINTLGVVGVPSYFAVDPAAGTVLTQQWYRNTGSGPVAISGATGATYTPTSTDTSVPTWLSVRGTAALGAFASPEFPSFSHVGSTVQDGTLYTKNSVGNVSAGYTALQPMRMRAFTGTEYTTATFAIDSVVSPGTYVAADFGDFTGHAGTPLLNIRTIIAPPAVMPKRTTRAATATRPAYNTGTGFFVKNGAVYDSNGNLFNIRGINQVHYDSNPAGLPNAGANANRVFIRHSNPWTTGGAPNKTVVFDDKLAVHCCPMPAASLTQISIVASFSSNIMTVTSVTFGYIYVGMHVYGVGSATFSSPYIIIALGTGTGGAGTYYFNSTLTLGSTTLSLMSTPTTGDPYYTILASTQAFVDQASDWLTYNDKCILNIANEWGAAASVTANISGISGTTMTVTSVNSGSFSIHRGSMLQLPDGTVVTIAAWGGAANVGTGTGGAGTYTIDQSLSYGALTVRECTWRERTKIAITMLRNAGFLMPLVVDAPGSGQSLVTLTTDGQALHDFDPEHNIILSLHIYGNGKPGGLDTYVAPLQAVSDSAGTFGGPAIILGEIGPGRDVNASGGDPTMMTPLEGMAVAESRGFGWMLWAWDDNDSTGGTSDDGGYAMVYNNGSGYGTSNPADLTTFGQSVVLDPYYGTLLAVPATSL
jgi:hypothetical protein